MRSLLLIFLFAIIQGIYCQNCSRTIQESNFCAKSCNPTRNQCKGSRDCVCDSDCGFSCVKRGMTCPKPRNIANGRVIYNTTTFGSTLKYRCISPYKLIGSKRRSCRGKGKWDGQAPTCKITCKDPGDIQHGTRTYGGFDLGMKVTYDCSPGLSMQGRATLTCKETGKWDNVRPSCVCERTNAKHFQYCRSSCDPENISCRGNKHCVCDGDCGFSCVPKAVDCGQPSRLRNGRREFSSTRFGSIAKYKCDKPYTLIGSAIRRCRGIGKWDGKTTKCKLLCKDPGDIQFATKQVYGLGLNEKVSYTCFPVYKMVGERILTCTERGQWDNAKPKCIVPQCGPLRIPSNAEISWGKIKRSYQYGESIVFRCKSGYFAKGLSIQKCDINGWSPSSFVCSPKSCGHPGNPKNGKATSYKFTFQSKVSFQCDYGFKLTGDQYRRCQANQMWSGKMPTCEPIDCGKLPTPLKAEKMMDTGTSVGGTVRFRCKEKGHEIHGSEIRTCQNDGTWSGVATSCKVVSCGDPGTPANGKQVVVKSNYTYGGSVEFKCIANYTMSGSARLYCEDTKDWSSLIPRCWAPCTDPGMPADGTRIGSDFRHDKSVTFGCHEDFTLNGENSIRCRDGRWSADKPTCQEIKCNDPGRPAHGRQAEVVKNYSYRGTVRFECSKNFTLSGKAVIRCMRNKNWDSGTPTCLAPCTDPGVPANGFSTGNDFRHGNSVSFRCHEDFLLKGRRTISCENGIWSADIPSCEVIRCKDPGAPDHGRQAEVTNSYSYPGTVRFECLPNYNMMGRPVIKCTKNAQWNSKIPSCFAPCKDPGSPLNGFRIGDKFSHSSVVRFECLQDFVLQGTPAVKCNDGHWNATTPTCQDCVHGFALGMEDGRIEDSSITASSYTDVFHAAHDGRLGKETYWCSARERESYLEINLSKRYKITAIKIELLRNDGIGLLEFKSKYFDRWTAFDKAKVQSTSVHKPFNPFIAKSLRVVVQRKVNQDDTVCLRAEVYGCAAPHDCIMRGSVVVGKQNDNYRRAYVRFIRGDQFQVIPNGTDKYPIFERKDAFLDEVPSATQLTYGAIVLGVDTISRKIRKGQLKHKDGSLWQIETDTSTWKSKEKDIRVIKEPKYCQF